MVSVELNLKQKRFVQEYLIDLNATQAAIRAEYSEHTAYSMGQRLLKNVEVQAALQEAIKNRAIRTEITQDRVLKELANIAFANGTDYAKVVKVNDESLVGIVPTDDLTADQRSAIVGIKQNQFGIEIKLNDKLKALELIGKHLGMFNDKNNGDDSVEDLTSLAEMLSDNDDKNTNN
jgi:phage terminase small subunit